jgi:hypothetical protein
VRYAHFWLLGQEFGAMDSAHEHKIAFNEAEEEPVDEPGGDVKPPKLVHYFKPRFSGSSKEAYVEGTVKLSTVVTTDGTPTDCRVLHGLCGGGSDGN